MMGRTCSSVKPGAGSASLQPAPITRKIEMIRKAMSIARFAILETPLPSNARFRERLPTLRGYATFLSPIFHFSAESVVYFALVADPLVI